MPVLQSIQQHPVVAIEGILNGTGNFILGALERGSSLNAAISQAQQLGFAEADPTRDLDGRDALDKLLVIAQQLSWSPPQRSTHRSSITTWASSPKATYPARHIAYLDQHSARVIVEPVEPGSPVASTHNERNIAILHHPDGSSTTLRGKGAGRWPTSESVIADLLEIARTRSQSARKELSYAQ
jgi:homoserine dehydrogenase